MASGPWTKPSLGIRDQHWMDDAACKSVGDYSPWYPEVGEGQSEHADMARQICLSCPVREQCLAYAIDADEWGLWGGTSREERHGRSKTRAPAPKQPPAVCRNGHTRTPENTITRNSGRECRDCRRDRQKRAYVRRGRAVA